MNEMCLGSFLFWPFSCMFEEAEKTQELFDLKKKKTKDVR